MAWDLDAAIGVLITQIGGRKQKTVPISEIAKAAAYASHELGSAQKVAERIRRPTARAQINDFVAINSLPPDVKSHLVDKRKVGIEVASELSRLRDPGRIREVARVLTKVKARDAMDIVGYAKEHPRLSAVRCKTRVLGSKDRVRNIEALVIPLEASEYAKLRMIALDMKKEPADIAREWVLDILARK